MHFVRNESNIGLPHFPEYRYIMTLLPLAKFIKFSCTRELCFILPFLRTKLFISYLGQIIGLIDSSSSTLLVSILPSYSELFEPFSYENSCPLRQARYSFWYLSALTTVFLKYLLLFNQFSFCKYIVMNCIKHHC